MSVSEQIANGIINYIKKHDPESSSPEVLRYDLIPKINLFFSCIFVLFVTGVTGFFIEGLVACVGFTVLRNNSGGIHFKTELQCNVVSIVLILAAVYIPIQFWYYGFISNVLALIVIVINAPSHSKKLELTDPRLSKKLKFVSIFIVSSNFIIGSPVLATAFFIQSLTTLKTAQSLIDKVGKEVNA